MTPPLGAQLTARDYEPLHQAERLAKAEWHRRVTEQSNILEQTQGTDMGAAEELKRLIDLGELEGWVTYA